MSRRCRQGTAVGVAVSAALVAAPASAFALGHAGDLDPTFNGGAPVQVQLARAAPASTGFAGLALDTAGRIVVAGNTSDVNGKTAAVAARLSAAGALDGSFGEAGSTVVQVGGGTGANRPFSLDEGLFLTPTGRVGLAIYRVRDDNRFDHSAFELLADGTPDLDFGSAGLATRDPVAAPGYVNTATAAVGPDGSVYAGGTYEANPTTGANRKLAITKFDNTGHVVSFWGNTAGTEIASYSQYATDTNSGVSKLVVLPNNKLLAVGSAYTTDSRAGVLLARFSATNGAPDTTFGTKPGNTLIQARDTGGSDSFANDVAVGPDGSLYVAGTADDAQDDQAMLIMKLTPSGEPDFQFAGNGIKRIQTATGNDPDYHGSYAQHIVLQADGKLLVIGGTRDAPDAGTGVVLRLMPNGTLDPSFGANGVVRLALAGSGGLRQFTSLGEGALADGRLLVSGSVTDTTSRGLVARILLDALPDPGPGGPGQPGGGTPPGGGGTIPVAPRGVLKLAASSLSVDSHGRVHVPLTCSATGPCTGKVLVVASDGTVVVATATKARRAATYAAGAYALKAGAKKTLALKLRTKGRSALRAHRKLTVRLVLAPTGQKATTKRIKLVAAKRGGRA